MLIGEVRNNYSKLNIPLIAAGVAILDAIVMFSIWTYEVKVGKKINSQSLIADGRESRMHLFSSAVVLFGLVSTYFNIPYLEGIAGIVIALLIFKVGIECAKDALFSLMDISPDKETEKDIKDVLKNMLGVKGFEDLKLRKSGVFIFGEVKVSVKKDVNVGKAYEISSAIEDEIKKKVSAVSAFVVSVKPYHSEKEKICIPIKKDKGLESEMSSYFGRADMFFFAIIDNKKIKEFYIKDNPCKDKEKRAGLCAAEFVIEETIDAIITQEMGAISLHTLRDDMIEVYEYKDGKVRDILKNYFENKILLLKKPTKKL